MRGGGVGPIGITSTPVDGIAGGAGHGDVELDCGLASLCAAAEFPGVMQPRVSALDHPSADLDGGPSSRARSSMRRCCFGDWGERPDIDPDQLKLAQKEAEAVEGEVPSQLHTHCHQPAAVAQAGKGGTESGAADGVQQRVSPGTAGGGADRRRHVIGRAAEGAFDTRPFYARTCRGCWRWPAPGCPLRPRAVPQPQPRPRSGRIASRQTVTAAGRRAHSRR